MSSPLSANILLFRSRMLNDSTGTGLPPHRHPSFPQPSFHAAEVTSSSQEQAMMLLPHRVLSAPPLRQAAKLSSSSQEHGLPTPHRPLLPTPLFQVTGRSPSTQKCKLPPHRHSPPLPQPSNRISKRRSTREQRNKRPKMVGGEVPPQERLKRTMAFPQGKSYPVSMTKSFYGAKELEALRERDSTSTSKQ